MAKTFGKLVFFALIDTILWYIAMFSYGQIAPLMGINLAELTLGNILHLGFFSIVLVLFGFGAVYYAAVVLMLIIAFFLFFLAKVIEVFG